MLRTPVSSSNVAAIGYDSKEKILEVEFISGSVYQYDQVPVDIWREFRRRQQSGESIGKYLNSAVKGTYNFLKIS